MMLFPGLDEVRIQWLAIQQGNYKLYGFLIYTGADVAIVEFLREGIIDLDILSGEECAIFLIEPPSKRWINYVKKKAHPWGKFFNELVNPFPEHDDGGNQANPPIANGLGSINIQDIRNSIVVLGQNNHITMNQLLEPDFDLMFDRSEAYKVAEHFDIAKNEVPCLVFFKDIDDDVIWLQSLKGYNAPEALKVFFRDFFVSPGFKTLHN